MYQHTQLGNFASELKKARDFVHKFIPRELSPTRMLEKYASDAKKKSAAKIAKVASDATAKNAAADAANSARIATLQLQTLPAPQMNANDAPVFAQNAPVSGPVSASDTDYTPWIIGAALLAGAVLIVRSRA